MQRSATRRWMNVQSIEISISFYTIFYHTCVPKQFKISDWGRWVFCATIYSLAYCLWLRFYEVMGLPLCACVCESEWIVHVLIKLIYVTCQMKYIGKSQFETVCLWYWYDGRHSRYPLATALYMWCRHISSLCCSVLLIKGLKQMLPSIFWEEKCTDFIRLFG